MISTHWAPECQRTEQWEDNPLADPLKAAKVIFTDLDYLKDEREQVVMGGSDIVVLCGYVKTNELIKDTDEEFEGYEPGQIWYKPTGETAKVKVSLKFEVVE